MDEPRNMNEILSGLPGMQRDKLAELWQRTFHRAPHRRLRVELMRPTLAWGLQEQSAGRFPGTARVPMRGPAVSKQAGWSGSNESYSRFRPGTRILREWGGKMHEVLLRVEGYEYDGRIYKSLSPIAKVITGTHWSGPAFFGTKRKDATS